MRHGYLAGLLAVATTGCDSSEPTPILTNREEVAVQSAEWIAKSDRNGDRRLDKVEWQAMMHHDFPDTPEDDLQSWGDRDFAYFNHNGDEFVSVEDVTTLGLEGFDCMDRDRDGRLTDQERLAAPNPACPSRDIVAE